MFTVSGRIYPIVEIDMPRTERRLAVTSSGHYVLNGAEPKVIDRPAGRRDYQLIYIHSGQGFYWRDGQERAVTAGHAVLYRPQEPQVYHYDPRDTPDIYWVHFTGGAVPEELGRYGLEDGGVFPVKVRDTYTHIFDDMIQELQFKRPYYDLACDARLQSLLALMARERSVRAVMPAPRTKEIEQAVRLFQTQFGQPFHLAEYAAAHNMSPCWFTRLFTRQMGVNPQQYLIDVRITRACELLASGATVSEVGETVGYQDPLYFSRVFKKQTGQSPAQYRKSVSALL